MSYSQKLYQAAHQQGHQQGHQLGHQQGHQLGHQLGHHQGHTSALIETAKAMLAQGFDAKIIQKITKLSFAKIKELELV